MHFILQVKNNENSTHKQNKLSISILEDENIIYLCKYIVSKLSTDHSYEIFKIAYNYIFSKKKKDCI